MTKEKLPIIKDKLGDELSSIFCKLHQNPELSNEEFETTRILKEALVKAGVTVLDLPLKTGLVAEVKGKEDGPVVAIRSDIDALPIYEETSLSYKSVVNGKMHACGHDFHATSILGAAYLLKSRESELAGTVKILFQPAEETAHGAEQVINTGVLSDVQAIFGLHTSSDLPVGTIGTNVGPLTAAVDRFEVTVIGIGAHAAEPERGIDPIVVAANIVTSLQTIISRNISAFDQALISITHIESGKTWNVIPKSAYLEGTVRTLNPETRKLIEKRIKEVIHGIAQSFGAEVEVKWHAGPPATNNTEEWTKISMEVASEIGYVVEKRQTGLGGEDFAYYQEEIPGTFIYIGTGKSYSHHHPKFQVDKSALKGTSEYFAKLAERALLELDKEKSES